MRRSVPYHDQARGQGDPIRTLVCVTGRSAAGKSTAADHLGESLSVPSFSLGSHQRARFSANGGPQRYHDELGLETTYYGLWDEWLGRIGSMMSGSRKGMVVEGVYTYAFVDALREAFRHDEVRILHIATSRQDRLSFHMKRSGLGRGAATAELERLDAIKFDVGLGEMVDRAHLTVRNTAIGGLAGFLRNAESGAAALFGEVRR